MRTCAHLHMLTVATLAIALVTLAHPANANVRSHQKIAEGVGGIVGDFDAEGRFGGSIASLGDLDGDGVTDIVVGEYVDGFSAGTQEGVDCTPRNAAAGQSPFRRSCRARR